MFIHKCKKPDGRMYYQLVENYREGGKIRRRILKHLGPVEKLLALDVKSISAGNVYIEDVSDVEFGASFVLNEICEKLNLDYTVDKHITKQAELISIGKVIRYAAIHKCVRQNGFNDIPNWFESSVLSCVEGISSTVLSKQNFNSWLDNFDADTVDRIQTSLSQTLLRSYNLDLSRVIIDFTNVDTYQKVREDRQLAKRGKPKSGKKSVLQINYALICSNDGIPLHHAIYDGNINDSEYFKKFSKNVLRKYDSFFKQKKHLVIVFDRGMNSKEAILWIASNYDFVGALKLIECEEVCKDITQYKLIKKDDQGYEVRVYEFKKNKFGKEFRGIASYHEKTAKLIEHQYDDKISKVRKELNQIHQKLNKPHWTNKDKVEKRIIKCLKKYSLKGLFDISLDIKQGKLLFKNCELKKESYTKLKQIWGISYIFTNTKKASAEEIIDIYFREKNVIEDCNKMLKQIDFCRIDPVRCWIDEHIRAHFLRCTIALTIGTLLANKVNKKLKTKHTPATIIDKLKRLNITTATIKPFNKKDIALSNYNTESKSIYDSLNLKQSFNQLKNKIR